MVTKEDVTFIIKNWNVMSVEEIAKSIKKSTPTIYDVVKRIRKQGMNLKKKTKGAPLKEIIRQAINELK